jgi:hypothetical protein
LAPDRGPLAAARSRRPSRRASRLQHVTRWRNRIAIAEDTTRAETRPVGVPTKRARPSVLLRQREKAKRGTRTVAGIDSKPIPFEGRRSKATSAVAERLKAGIEAAKHRPTRQALRPSTGRRAFEISPPGGEDKNGTAGRARPRFPSSRPVAHVTGLGNARLVALSATIGHVRTCAATAVPKTNYKIGLSAFRVRTFGLLIHTRNSAIVSPTTCCAL